jgi:UDP-3-O-[3-hydroxymyristoyl] glucosamine N-acyltransferase
MQRILQSRADFEKTTPYGRFFRRRKEYLTIEEIGRLIQLENINQLRSMDKIYDIKVLELADKNELTFFNNDKYLPRLHNTKAGYCLLTDNHKADLPKNVTPLLVKNVYNAYAVLLDHLYLIPQFVVNPGVAAGAFVDSSANIGTDTEIQPGAHVEKDVQVGTGCKICANAVIGYGCRLGNNTYVGPNSTVYHAEIGNCVVIKSNCNIGQNGFGFAPQKGFNYKIPHRSHVEIGDYVEIGSSTCVDQGVLENTVIASHTKIDNLVQIAHGVKIGSGCFIAAQVGIAGSAVIGDHVQVGGKAGIANHVKIGSGVQIAACSGVTKDLEENTVVGGFPAVPIKEWQRSIALLRKLAKNRGN